MMQSVWRFLTSVTTYVWVGLAFCLAEIRKVLGSDMNITVQVVDDIPLTMTGKYRVTISEIAR